MTLRSLIVFVVLGLSVAGAKSYEITLQSASKAGKLRLLPGRYKVEAIDPEKVRFTDLTSGKSKETEGKLVNTEKRFTDTSINATQVQKVSEIHEIGLGGTNSKIVFE